MGSYINTARHAITLPNGRPVGTGEQFEYDGPLDDHPLGGSLLRLEDAPASEVDSPEPHDRPPASSDSPAAQTTPIESSEAFGTGQITQGPPREAEAQETPKRSNRKRGET